MSEVSAALLDIAHERLRQITAEDWSPEHDDLHSHGEMAKAAACYADADRPMHGLSWLGPAKPVGWPWAPTWWKPSNRRRDLVKAGALIVAEIERIDRAGQSR